MHQPQAATMHCGFTRFKCSCPVASTCASPCHLAPQASSKLIKLTLRRPVPVNSQATHLRPATSSPKFGLPASIWLNVLTSFEDAESISFLHPLLPNAINGPLPELTGFCVSVPLQPIIKNQRERADLAKYFILHSVCGSKAETAENPIGRRGRADHRVRPVAAILGETLRFFALAVEKSVR